MANVISDETMEYVGILAKLELSKEEQKAARKDMERMLDYIDKLNELDTAGVCLLYTSPSPRDLSTSRMPSSA